MRPRSRLLAKRGLPTIREGHEEQVLDRNHTNSQQHSSAQDYLFSICQLARPAFPLREPDCDILALGPQPPPKPCPRAHRLREPPRPAAQATAATTIATSTPSGAILSSQEEGAGSRAIAPDEPEDATADRRADPGPADPLEFLYSHRGALSFSRRASVPMRRTRSDSFPRPSPGLNAPRKSSCPELCLTGPAPGPGPAPTVLQRSPLSRKKLEDPTAAPRVHQAHGRPDSSPGCGRGKSGRGADKQTMVSHWIAECRSAWREARVRACMLPAIAEK